MKKYQFKHNANRMHEAFMIEEETGYKVVARIIFETLVATCTEKDLKEAGDEVPEELMKKTTALERIINTTADDQEQLYAIFSFMIYHEKTLYVLQKQAETEKRLSDESIISKLRDGALDVFDGINKDLLESKIEDFIREKRSEFKAFDRLKKQVINSNYDFMLFSAIIDGDYEYVIDTLDKTVADV